jgi:hypothetical protein
MRRTVQEEDMEDIQDVDAFTEAEGRRLLTAAFETVPADTVLAGNGLAGNGLAGAELLRRVRRRTSRRRARPLVPAGAVAAAGGAVALSVTLTTTVADAPSALAAVTAAAAKTSAQSFRVTVSISQGDEKPVPPQITGVFDPGHGLGEEIVDGRTQIRFVGGHIYAKFSGQQPPGKTWMEGQIPPPLPPAIAGQPAAAGFIGNEPIDPGALLGLLKSAGSVQAEGPASGPGWTGTKYAFTSPHQPGGRIVTESGAVYVDNQGRVRRLMTTVRWRLSVSSTHTTRDFTTMYDVTFGGFGVRVSVTEPPASQVASLGEGYLYIGSAGQVPSLGIG